MARRNELDETMPPKKTIASSKPNVSKVTQNKPKVQTKGISPKKAPVSKGTGKVKNASSKGPSKSNSTTKSLTSRKKTPTKEYIAAVKIQTSVRSFLAKVELSKLKEQKQRYEEMIENIQKQAWLDIIKQQREEDEKQRQKEEEERKKKREQLKWKKDILEAAFNGQLEQITKILKQVEDRVRSNSTVSGESLDRMVDRFKMNLIESEDANGNSTISEASAGGNPQTVLFFIENRASVNSLGQFHRTPLYRAAFGGHLENVKIILEHGGDPRIHDNEGVLPEQVAALPEIVDVIKQWDISRTDAILERLNEEKEKKMEEERKHGKKEQERKEKTIRELESEYSHKQRNLQKAYQEMNKWIYEHDTCVAERFERTDVTLQAIHDAEDVLLHAQKEEKICRDKLAEYRLELRQQEEDGSQCSSDSGCIKCNIKDLDDVLMRDVGDKIRESGKWPLLIDSSSQAVTFLRYRDTNYINSLNPKDLEIENLRLALLGAIRYGKALVLDMMEVNMLELIEDRCNEIQQNLFQDLISSKQILSNDRYLSLIRPNDNKEYSKEKFVPSRVKKFSLVLATKMWQVPSEWIDTFYAIKIITPSIS